jgi:hypothetical protein
MEIIDGEKVVTNKKDGSKLVLRGGAWVPYTPKQGSAYERYFAKPATQAVGNLLTGGPAGLLFQGRPLPIGPKPDSPMARKLAENIVPQTPGQAGRDIGMIAGGELLAPAEGASLAYKIGAPLGRTALTALTSAVGEKLAGGSALKGAEEGALQQGTGEAAAPAINFLGSYGKTALNAKDVKNVGGLVSDLIPSLGDVSTVPKFDAAFRGGEATEKAGQKLGTLEESISKQLGKKPIGTMMVQTSGRTPMTVRVKASFDDMVDKIRDLNRIGYAYSGDAQQKALAADARREAHDLTEELSSALNKQQPGLGDKFLKVRREYAKASLFTRIFSDPDLYDASGRLNMNTLQELAANRGSAGFREDLIRVLGRDDTNKFLDKVYRNAPSTARDVDAGLNMGLSFHPGTAMPRIFAHPRLGQKVGEIPRRLPKISPTAPAILLGRLKDYLSQGQVTP